jgi:hypothetical protein
LTKARHPIALAHLGRFLAEIKRFARLLTRHQPIGRSENSHPSVPLARFPRNSRNRSFDYFAQFRFRRFSSRLADFRRRK